MIRISIAANGNPNDPSTWSRTPFNIIESFKKLDKCEMGECIDLNHLCNINTKFYNRILRKIFYVRGSLRDPMKFKSASKNIQRKIDGLHSNVYIFCAEHAINFKNKKDCKTYIYIDAILRPKFQLTKDSRLLKNQFLSKYEENEIKSFNNADGIFTLNEWTKDFLINEYNIEKSKIYNVGFGINTELYYGDKDYNNKTMLIVLREGTEYSKGLWLLLDAFKILKMKMPDAILNVVGVREQRYIEGVNYYYNESRKTTIELFKKSSLFVMPNITEVNGIVYLEALAHKTPIVGLNRFAFPEFCGNGQWGFICDKPDSKELSNLLFEALSNPEELKKMGQYGQRFVENTYSWDLVVSKMLKTIEKDSNLSF